MNKKFFLLLILLSMASSKIYAMQKQPHKKLSIKIKPPDVQANVLFAEAKELLNIGEEGEAFKLITQSAKKNLLEAQFQLALMLYKGIGCNKDIKTALKLCNIAAKRGSRPAKKLLNDIITTAIIEILETLEAPIQLDLSEMLKQLGQSGEEDDVGEEENNSETEAAKKIHDQGPPAGMYL